MQKLLEIVKFLVANGPDLIAALAGVFSALVAVFLFVPGPQPEATFKKIADFLAKFSRKPKAE